MVPVSTRSGDAQKHWIERVQKRLAVTSSMLKDMKAVQMLGLTDVLFTIISKLRQIEVETSVRFRKLMIWQVALSNLPMDLAPFATFAIYAVIALVRQDGSILSAQAFTSLALISLMTSPLLTFCQAMPSLLQAFSCFDRIETYCVLDCRPQPASSYHLQQSDSSSSDGLELQCRSSLSGDILVSFQNATISRTRETDPVLQSVSLVIRKGITMVIGPVGSGKSTLIESILGETTLRSGSVSPSLARFAYCPQVPWIQNNTIRQNIVGASEIDENWYAFVLSTCGLEEDLGVIPGGDSHMTGSSGVALSGGQKQRIILARAIYSRLEVTILDNVFSGVDSNNVALITSRLFGKEGHFRKSGRSAILVTNSYDMLSLADNIIVIEGGRIADVGSYEAILQRNSELTAMLRNTSDHDSTSAFDSTAPYTIKTPEIASQVITEVAQIEDIDQSRQTGTWGVYLYYLRSTGYIPLAFFGIFAVSEAFTANFSSMVLGSSSAIRSDSADTSFDSDMGAMLIVLCAIGNYVAGPVPVLAVVLYFIQSYYLRTSRQVRLLDIEAKAPLYTHFLETIEGILTIRAFHWQPQLQLQCQRLLNQSQKPIYMLFCIQQWLKLVLDLVVGGIAVILVVFVTSFKDKFTSASIGVALNLLLTFNQSLTQAIKMWTMMEISIGAVSRIERFVQDTPSEQRVVNSLPPPLEAWPSCGAIQFERVTASYTYVLPCSYLQDNRSLEINNHYSPATSPVLKNLTLAIQPGEKIAVCGPSGSGKTSLIMALLQMLDVSYGRITIDGVDLSVNRRNDIRSRLNVIPQDPFFIPGSIRLNLDPHGCVSDELIQSALKKVGLWNRINSNGNLENELSASDWSVGQRQLLALARALLIKSPILILDEAVSSVDWETESIMQDIIEKEFSQQTVIAVVQRFRYINRFGRVALLKHGELIEYESSEALLNRNSEFRKLYLALQKPS
ncbi:MAG: hypothetical protein Q9187_004917 [Circinaria calcarea]